MIAAQGEMLLMTRGYGLPIEAQVLQTWPGLYLILVQQPVSSPLRRSFCIIVYVAIWMNVAHLQVIAQGLFKGIFHNISRNMHKCVAI